MRACDRFRVEGARCRLGARTLPVLDLSLGGLFVEDRQGGPPPGQFVELALEVGPGAPLRVVGKVVWRRASGDRPAGFGVRITRIALQDKLSLVERLRRAGAPAAAAPRRSSPAAS